MLFKEVIGQAPAKQELLNKCAQDHLGHAQLFCGPEGSGKLSMALALAQYLVCENPQASDSCGTCAGCTKAQKHIHPDIHFSFPIIGNDVLCSDVLKTWREALHQSPYLNMEDWLQFLKADNRQANIHKKECVDIIRKLSLKAYEARHKVLIIWQAEYLGKEGNVLLKTIEEPTPNTFIILIAQQSGSLLPTIVSRTHQLLLKPIDSPTLAAALQEKLTCSPSRSEALAWQAKGNFRKARQMFFDETEAWSKVLDDWLSFCYQHNLAACLQWSSQMHARGREKQKNFVSFTLDFVQSLLNYQMLGAQARLNNTQIELLKKWANILPLQRIGQLNALLNKSFFYLERNIHAKILFFNLSLQIHKLLQTKHKSVENISQP
ncbi:MAG: hypothetical protein R2798_03170 [Chitinophagales bacterium]